MAQWLRPCTAFIEDQSSVPSTHIGWVQLQEEIQDWLLDSTGTHTHLYMPSHLQRNMKKRKKIGFGAKHYTSCMKPKREKQDDYTEI